MDEFSAEVIRKDTHVVISVAGEVDLLTSSDLRARLSEVLAAGDKRVILDLSGVTFLDCAGLGVLVAARNRAHEDGGAVCIAAPSPRVRRVVDLAGLAPYFSFAASVDDAVDITTDAAV
jgi:anti-anti-sigma factor